MVRRKFSREFRIEAVRLVTERGVSVPQACRDLDLVESVLRRWMKELSDAPSSAFPGNGQQRAELAEIAALKKEVAKLKAKYGGLELSDAKRLKQLEDENAKLKRLLADTMLDNVVLKDLLGKP